MRNRVLLIGGVIIVGLFLILSVSALLNRSRTAAGVCNSFMKALVKGDAAKSYSLFSPNATGQESLAEWATTVKNVDAVYGAKPVYLKTTQSDTTNPTVKTQLSQIHYALTGKGGKYTIQCSAVKAGKKFMVDGFSSQLVQ